MKKYLPHKHQLEFHQSEARFRTFIAGRRGGKSLAGTIEALRWADLKPKELGRPTHGMVIAPTYGMLQDVNIAMIMEWCPEHAIQSWNKVDKNLVLVNGSTISFRSADNPDRLRGTEKDWIWLDEARDMSKYVWEVVYPVLTTTNGCAWVTTTPQGYDWVYETFYKPALQGDKDFEAWQFTTLDNPHIDPEMVEKAKKDLSDVMFKQEYMATFEKFEGLVYPDFSEKRHVKTGYTDITDNYFVGLDVGWNHPTACLLAREDKDRVLYVIDEFREQQLTVDMISNRLNGMLAANDITQEQVEMFVIDPASRGTSQTSGQSILDQLHEKGWGFVPGNNNVMSGINRMTKLLKEDKLFIAPKCEKLVEELNTYHWRKWREEGDNERNKPFKVGEDLCLVGSSLISTPRGWKELSKIRLGDKVLTREGAKTVQASSKTGVDKEVVRVYTTEGYIDCTPNHPIITSKGKIVADSLRYYDIIYTWRQQYSKVENMSGRGSTTGVSPLKTQPFICYIELFGKILTAIFQMVWLSITKTVMHVTTRLRTLKYLQGLNTRVCMQGKTAKTRTIKGGILSIWKRLENLPKSGTPVKRGGSGTQNTESNVGLIRGGKKRFVSSVKKNIKQKPHTKSFVPTVVSLHGEGRSKLTTHLGLAVSVVKSLLLTNILKQKPAHVLAVVNLRNRQNVYNLTVENIHEYYANGILVSNCDSLRYIVASRPDWFERKQVDMYGRLVEQGADPITGLKPESEGDVMDILTEGSVLDDMI